MLTYFRQRYKTRVTVTPPTPGAEPIELVRSHTILTPDQIMGWQRDIDPSWIFNVEQTMDDKFTMTDRR